MLRSGRAGRAVLLLLAWAVRLAASGEHGHCGPVAAFWTVPLVDADVLSLRITPNETIGSYTVVASRWHVRGEVGVYCRHRGGGLIGSVRLDPSISNVNNSGGLLGGAVVVTNGTRAHIFSWRQIEACLPRNAAFRECAVAEAHRGRLIHEYMGYSHGSETTVAKVIAFGCVTLILLASLLCIVPRAVEDARRCFQQPTYLPVSPDWFDGLPNVLTHSPRAIAPDSPHTQQQPARLPLPRHVPAAQTSKLEQVADAVTAQRGSKALLAAQLIQIADASAAKRREGQLQKFFDAILAAADENERHLRATGEADPAPSGTTSNSGAAGADHRLLNVSISAGGGGREGGGGGVGGLGHEAATNSNDRMTELLALSHRILGCAGLSQEDLEDVLAALRAM